MSARTLTLDLPHPRQAAFLDAPERWKVANWGRRAGKTNGLFTAALCGHGPGYREGHPRWPGVLQGRDVVWFTIDYGQAQAVWREEIAPRFEAVPGASLNNSTFSCFMPGGGGLHVRSAERPKVIRGFGKKLGLVIYDEGAHYDALAIHQDVARPALMDNKGSALWGSSPNMGTDGNREGVGGVPLLPSGFNRLCEEILAGTRTGWYYSHATARDNPMVDPGEFAALLEEYRVKGGVALAQEIEAELLRGGAGYAFPEWVPEVHVGRFYRDEVLREWPWYAGLDWGYRSPGALVVFACGPEGRIHVRWDWKFEGITPQAAGKAAGERFKRRGTLPLIIGADAAMDSQTGLPSHLEEFRKGLVESMGAALAPTLVAVSKQGMDRLGHRQTRTMLTHQALAVTQALDGTIPEWGKPRMTFDPDAGYCRTTIPLLVVDPHDPESVDTKGDDHAWDALTYGLMLRPVGLIPEGMEDRRRDVHHGYDAGGQKRKPWTLAETDPSPRRGTRWQGYGRRPANTTTERD